MEMSAISVTKAPEDPGNVKAVHYVATSGYTTFVAWGDLRPRTWRWGRWTGKRQAQRICDKAFYQYSGNAEQLELSKLHLVILVAYDKINKAFPKPHKSPPIPEDIDDLMKDIEARTGGNKNICHEEFCKLMMKWLERDLRAYTRNKVLQVLASALAMAAITRSATRPMPRLHQIVDKVPISVLASVYTLGLSLIDDVGVD